MKKTIKTPRAVFRLTLAIGAAGMIYSFPVRAAVTDADFDALKAAVHQLSDQVQSLRQTNILMEQRHQLDAQQLKELQSKLAVTQQTALDAEQKASQPPARQPLDEATVNHNFQMLGDAEVQYVNADKQKGAFVMADFAPIFLYRGGDNILFESGFDFGIQNNAPAGGGYKTTLNLSFAQLDYVVNDYMTLCAGNLLLPLGTYTERGAGWLNKIPDNPLAIDLIPGNGVGAELRGALPLGQNGMLFNYAIYCVNGPGSADGTGNASALDVGGNVGIWSDGTTANLHRNPAGGARVAVFVPFKPRYDLEVGASVLGSEWDNAGNHLYTAGVLDAALHLGPNFEARGEYVLSRYGSDDAGLVHQQGWFTQASYKLAGLNLDSRLLNNLEAVARYDAVHYGLSSNFTQRSTFGFIYYLTGALLLEGDYEIIRSTDPAQPASQLILQMSYGF